MTASPPNVSPVVTSHRWAHCWLSRMDLALCCVVLRVSMWSSALSLRRMKYF
ncbi:MAG TPA: hypothetical protein VNA23_01560 [Anaerolineales bacterium]|nr:hypothetical protein [Anaerolineales bacterium]